MNVNTRTRSPASAGPVAGVVLAGGRGRRMGGRDKGLVIAGGRPLVSYVLDRLRPQVDSLLINANRNQDRYARLGAPVAEDATGDFRGPLAGVLSAMRATDCAFLLTAPCDAPLFPDDLCRRLGRALISRDADIAVAHDGERLQPVFALLRTSLQPSLEDFLSTGERKIDRWFARHHTVPVDFSDQPARFLNVNTPEERDDFEHLKRRADDALGT